MCLSGQRFNKHFGQCLHNLGFEQTNCEANIWIQDAGNVYEYVTTYVDNLCLTVKEPLKLLNDLTKVPYRLKLVPYRFKLKGFPPLEGAVHLGCKFDKDKNGVLYMDPNQYINHMEDAYCHQFRDNPNTKVKSLLEPGDHPELDTSPYLNKDDTQIYQSLICAIQWTISIGR